MSDIQYKVRETKTAKNAEIAASASEQVITETTRMDHYNAAIIQNLDVNSDVEVRLDVHTDRPFFAQKGGGVVDITPDFGLKFRIVTIVNRNSGAVVAANAVLVNVYHQEVIK